MRKGLLMTVLMTGTIAGNAMADNDWVGCDWVEGSCYYGDDDIYL